MHKTLTKTLAAILCFATALSAGGTIDASKDARLRGSFRKPDRNGWIQVHLQGAPAEMGFQHGYHLAAEIADAKKVIELEFTHDSDKDYAFYRDAAKKILWPHVEQQYREELQGIADGVKARGVNLDLWDIVTINAWQELSPYYEQWRDAKYGKRKKKANPNPPERCSAFVATGSYTKDGGIVMGHNAWTGYMDGARWTVVFDVVPASGEPFIMDGFPGLIHSADDFGVNASGIMITETTISQFKGFDPDGIPEFVRARKAMQYSKSIDDFVRVMKDGNNGGYANTWLVAIERRARSRAWNWG